MVDMIAVEEVGIQTKAVIIIYFAHPLFKPYRNILQIRTLSIDAENPCKNFAFGLSDSLITSNYYEDLQRLKFSRDCQIKLSLSWTLQLVPH